MPSPTSSERRKPSVVDQQRTVGAGVLAGQHRVRELARLDPGAGVGRPGGRPSRRRPRSRARPGRGSGSRARARAPAGCSLSDRDARARAGARPARRAPPRRGPRARRGRAPRARRRCTAASGGSRHGSDRRRRRSRRVSRMPITVVAQPTDASRSGTCERDVGGTLDQLRHRARPPPPGFSSAPMPSISARHHVAGGEEAAACRRRRRRMCRSRSRRRARAARSRERYAICSSSEKIICAVLESCITSPLTAAAGRARPGVGAVARRQQPRARRALVAHPFCASQSKVNGGSAPSRTNVSRAETSLTIV